VRFVEVLTPMVHHTFDPAGWVGRGHGARRAELGLVRPTLRGVRLSSPKWRIVQQHEFFLLGPEFPRIFSRECGCYSGITHGARLRDHIGYR